MGVEIERKFLVRRELLPALPEGDDIVQGYLAVKPTVRVRLRVSPDGARAAELTIKGPGLVSRAEFNYPLPAEDVEELLRLCARRIAKRRHVLGRWEIDHFPERDLWLAEIELAREDEPFERPAWLGDEVSDDPAYSNANLASETPSG